MATKILNPDLVSDETESEEVDLQYIIENKPPPKVVREFLRENICSIRSKEDIMFDQIEEENNIQ